MAGGFSRAMDGELSGFSSKFVSLISSTSMTTLEVVMIFELVSILN